MDPAATLLDCYVVYEQNPTSTEVAARTKGWRVVRPIVPVTGIPYRMEIFVSDDIVLSGVYDRGADRVSVLLSAWTRVLDVIIAEPAATISRLRAALDVLTAEAG